MKSFYLKKKSNIIMGLVIVILITVISFRTLFAFPNATDSITIKNATDIPIIGIPTTSPGSPSTNETTIISCPINDPDGVKNATLFWQYSSINSTIFNTSMVESDILILDTTEFNRTGYITSTGVETTDSTERKFGEFMYTSAGESALNKIDTSINRPGPTSLIYVRIEGKNISTNEWEILVEEGSYASTTDLSAVNYVNDVDLFLGYKIYAVTYRSEPQDPLQPNIDKLELYQQVYSADIPGASGPSKIDYYVTSYNNLNESTTSETYSFLMDYQPIVQIHNPPSVLAGDGNIHTLNVSVTDLDGVYYINNNSVILYYRIEEKETWSSITLIKQEDGSHNLTTVYFEGNISGNLEDSVTTTLYLQVNATNLLYDYTTGRTGYSAIEEVILDSLHPQVAKIELDGDYSAIGLENITTIDTNITVIANFTDPSGIKEANIYYAMPNTTEFIKLAMVNTTNILPEEISLIFNATLPYTNETMFVEYFFETEDFLGNRGNTSVNWYYADGEAPVISALRIYPDYIANFTEVAILFNATDFSEFQDGLLWYSFDEETWMNKVVEAIDYDLFVDYNEIFAAANLPYLIEDNTTRSVYLYVARNGKVDTAVLNVDITHENPTDLRIWLKTQDGREFLIYDRSPNTNSFNIEVDMIKLGLTQKDFTSMNFTLRMTDYSEYYSGMLTAFNIQLKHHSIPLGYQFLETIPQSVNDTDVQFYLTLTDQLGNVANSSIYTYYADGMVPNITLSNISSPLNVEGARYVTITAEIIDRSGINGAELYYKYKEKDNWIILSMNYNSSLGQYYANVPLINESGTIYYKVRAFDMVGFVAETNMTSFEHERGLAPIIELVDVPYPSPYDLEGNKTITIRANITDNSNFTATLYYRFEEKEGWTQILMKLDPETGLYYAIVEIEQSEGILYFKISAIDESDLETETDLIVIEYINGGKTVNPLVYIIGGAIGGTLALTGLIVVLIKKGMFKKLKGNPSTKSKSSFKSKTP